jgi:hypothetical protein
MNTQGSLAERDFPSLLQELSELRWTGTLTLTHAGVGKSVSIMGGRMVFAASSSPDDRMGALLLRRGRITLRQHEEAVVSPGKRFGAVLVEQGVLSPKELIAAVVEHAQEILYGAFQWTEGQYRLQEGTISSESITLRMSTPDIIVEGIRRIESWTRIAAAVGGPNALYERTPGWEEIAHGMKVPPEPMALLRRLDVPLTVEGLCGDPALSDFEVCRTLWAFRVIGLVRRGDAVPSAAAIEDESLGIVVPEE